ncbi:methionyl-tRNA formyltransferase, mitochondrial [Lampris incognitus]|uniref:methionyl-tRNA formyltransferase, mitochondrial n=1 Tax=Lampris incognitus TaxID=2546036 RepID=UPI0024B625B7|nr:methionyl-tRNA formyltransferase, mitochondrial [Lampris incognitus]
MWTDPRLVCLQVFCSSLRSCCVKRRVVVGLRRKEVDIQHPRCCRPASHHSCLLYTRPYSTPGPPRRSTPGPPRRSTPGPPPRSTPGPPWRVLFFGTDHFAVESLKRLTSARSSSERIVESLEVVSLSSDTQVKKFADQNQLPVHPWPPGDVYGRFDVGVVVSFGCLLRESLINQLPHGILNVHPSLLPRWRGPAPIFHTILHGDTVTGVTIMQIHPRRFDVGPILHQTVYQVPENCTADQLGATLATEGAQLLIETLKTLPERIANRREQGETGATLAPKIRSSLSWIVWEEQTCDQISRLYRAIGSRIPLRTIWMGKTIKLMDFVGNCQVSISGHGSAPIPGSVRYLRERNTLAVCCKDGWVGFKAVVLKKRLSAADFYNGYLHQSRTKKPSHQNQECRFLSNRTEAYQMTECTDTRAHHPMTCTT